MKQYYELMKMSPLFRGITKNEELTMLLKCIDGNVKAYGAGETIISEGEDLYFAGMLLSGVAQELAADGSALSAKDFGELLTGGFSEGKSVKAPAAVIAKTDCEVLWVRWIRAARICNFSCPYHKKALENLNRLMEKD